MSDRLPLSLSVIALALSGFAIYASTVGMDAEAGRSSLEICSQYRQEVLTLREHGLSDEEIVDLLQLARVNPSGDQGAAYNVLSNQCGEVSAFPTGTADE